VLVNLLSNGIKFTNTGEVVVEVKVLSRPDPSRNGAEPWHLHFSVRDTGIGIPVDRLARLFKSFSQADASTTRHYGGTGLGLAISKRLVELMGGKMWVESVPQKGSTFHFTLPLCAGPEAATQVDPAQASLHGMRVFIVDDNPTVCRVLATHAAQWGMSARTVTNAAQALQCLNSAGSTDLVIVDADLADMPGASLAAEIRKAPQTQTLPVILLTSIGARSEQDAVLKELFSNAVAKPIKPAPLLQAVLRAVSGAKPAQKKDPVRGTLDPTLARRLPLRVLLCDDNSINQKVAMRLLQQMGYQAELAGNGVEALSALDRQPYDLIFMDVMMPEMGGLEATRLIRERQRHNSQFPNYKSSIIIVAMTASAMKGDREKCLAAGMDDYIAKPVRLEDVRNILERWGNVATKPEIAEPRAVAQPSPDMNGGSHTTPTSREEPPVDMERLLEFTDGSKDSLRELVTLYLSQTAEQLEKLEGAIGASLPGEVRRLAHSCAGASATCGMRRLVPILRELERLGLEASLSGAPELCQSAKHEFQCIRTFLDAYLASQAALVSQS
jgi:CheY-like chemotaxis protein